MSEDVNKTLAERGARYGAFIDHAILTQSFKAVAHNQRGWENLQDDQREALDMIFHKIGRILCGDPNYDDSWRDIAGYAMLVCNRLTETGPK